MKVKQYGNKYQSCENKIKYGHEQTAKDAVWAMEARHLPRKIRLLQMSLLYGLSSDE